MPWVSGLVLVISMGLSPTEAALGVTVWRVQSLSEKCAELWGQNHVVCL
jgi:hypothetical protein